MEHEKLHIKKWENHKQLIVDRNVWSPVSGLVIPLPGASSMRFFLLLTAPTTAKNRRYSMSEGKRWFKVWNSILIDPGFDSLPNDCAGIWTKLGALISKHGSDGKIKLSKIQFFKWTNTQQNEIEYIANNMEKVNVKIIHNDNGDITVSFNNWKKYQEITDSYARVKKYRMKQKETLSCNADKEEKRREENKKRKDNTNTDEYDFEFEEFWKQYPKKIGKGAVFVSWKKLGKGRPPLVDLLNALGKQSKSLQWSQDNGKYIPNPLTWLNQKRWGDELDSIKEVDDWKG